MRVIVTSRKDGRGLVKPFAGDKDHSGEPFFIGNEELTIGKDNRVYIPRRIMDSLGFLRADGSRAVVLETGATHLEGELIQGGDILSAESLSNYLERGKTGDRIPLEPISKAVEEGDLRILKATDRTDLYIG